MQEVIADPQNKQVKKRVIQGRGMCLIKGVSGRHGEGEPLGRDKRVRRPRVSGRVVGKENGKKNCVCVCVCVSVQGESILDLLFLR